MVMVDRLMVDVCRFAVIVARGFGRIEAVELAQLQGYVFID
jgi:hypothetical protein